MIIYNLQTKQLEFSNSEAKYRLYGGAKGGGKSYAMRSECVKQCLSAPMVRGLALRRTNPEIKENMVIPMQQEVPLDYYKYNGQDNTMKFDNGSTLRFSYCRNIQDVLRYQGIEYDFICIEELTHWNEQEFKILMSCLRSSRKGIRPNFFGSTNPGGVGHGWVKRLWIDRDFNYGEDPNNYDFIPATVYDNAVLAESMPEYVEDLKALPEEERRAYLEGDWDVFKGQYFKEFRRDIHVIPPTMPNPDMIKKRIICLDYGYAAPSAVYWMSQDTQGKITCYRELYVTEHTYSDLAKKIREMTPQNENINAIIADPAIVNKTSETVGTTGADEFKKQGLKITGADNERLKGWQIMRDYLKVKENPNTRMLDSDFKITENCNELIRTLPQQIHDQTKVEDMNTKGEDHACDAIRYGLVFLHGGTKSIKSVKKLNDMYNKKNYKDFTDIDTPARLIDQKF